MALWSRIGLLTIVIVYHLCHSNRILDSVNNSDAYDNFLNNISENVVGIDTDNQSDAPSFKSTSDQTRILDGESGFEETGIINSNLSGNSVDDPMTSTRPKVSDTPTRISSIYSTAAVINTDSDTSTSKPGSDFAVDIESYLTEIESLCPGINVCGRTRDYDDTAPTYEINHCCLNCSCEPSCIDNRNCCYDDLVTDGQHELFDCLMPIVGDYGMSEMPLYRFVVAPPMDGCKTTDHIKTENIRYMDENVSPWGDFYPIYSKSFNLNFINEKTAICHGANDIEHWKPMAINRGNYQGGQVMTNFFSTFNFSSVFIVFEPPRPEIKHSDFMCFRELRGSCPIKWINNFPIPSDIQTDRERIVAACEHGPRALYWVNNIYAYKNVYCALCNRLIKSSQFSDHVYCGYSEMDERHFRFKSFLVVLLSLDFIESVNTQGADLRDKPTAPNCYRPENYVNDVECVPLQCPMFQIRLADRQCGYPSAVLLIESINVLLNLSTTNTTDATFINNLTEAELNSLFQHLSPWKGCWVIESIGLLLDTNRTEFIIQLNCKAEHFELSNLNKGLRKSLSKTWRVPFNNTITHFKQQLDKHGSTHSLGFQPNRTIFTPIWSRALTGDRIRSSSMLKKVFWKTLYKKHIKITSYNLLINKLFFCNQIELRNIEYELQYTILYLKRIRIHLYPEEYSLFEDEFGSQRALVCLEDSGYIKAGSVTMAMHWCFVVMIFLCLELLATLTNRILFG